MEGDPSASKVIPVGQRYFTNRIGTPSDVRTVTRGSQAWQSTLRRQYGGSAHLKERPVCLTVTLCVSFAGHAADRKMLEDRGIASETEQSIETND